MHESQSLALIELLKAKGAGVALQDPLIPGYTSDFVKTPFRPAGSRGYRVR